MQVGNGLFHCPSCPHISTEMPFRYFPGPSQLNVRMWLGRMGIQFYGKPFTVNPWTVGGGSHLEDETKEEEEEKKQFKRQDSDVEITGQNLYICCSFYICQIMSESILPGFNLCVCICAGDTKVQTSGDKPLSKLQLWSKVLQSSRINMDIIVILGFEWLLKSCF